VDEGSVWLWLDHQHIKRGKHIFLGTTMVKGYSYFLTNTRISKAWKSNGKNHNIKRGKTLGFVHVLSFNKEKQEPQGAL
jgi:hypothetical protein